MHADTAILTGARHTSSATPCQDYCAAGMLPDGRAWGVIADGCSTGGQTDLGARAWALAAREVIKLVPDFETEPETIRQLILEHAAPLLNMLDQADGYATLGLLQVKEKHVRAMVFGDGVLIARHLDGGVTFINITYGANAPFYLNYLREPGMVDAWRTKYAGQQRRAVMMRYDADGILVDLKTDTQPGEAPWVWDANVESDELELVMLATDGATDAGETPAQTIRDIAAVKTPVGEFMKRRIAKLTRTWQRAGQMPADDFSVAAIWLGALTTTQENNHG